MQTPPIVSRPEWDAAHATLLVREKELTRARDRMAAERRRMPWLEVDKPYGFDGPGGRSTLADLVQGRRQLIVPEGYPQTLPYAWWRWNDDYAG